MKKQEATIMKKRIVSIALLAAVSVTLLAGCGSKKSSETVLTVGASPSPHAEILEQVKGDLKKEGIKLKIVQYSDYVQPNEALNSGDLDANYFQHKPYMDEFNKEKGTKLVSVGTIHYEPLGIYAGKTKSLSDLKDGAQIAIPNDTTNEARALLLLETQKLITLKDGAGLNATVKDIKDNPKNLNIVEIEAAQIPHSLQDVDLAVLNGNYAIQAGLSVSKDALAIETADSTAAKTYANIIAVKKGNENNKAVKALVKALQSEKIKKYINDKYDGSVVPAF